MNILQFNYKNMEKVPENEIEGGESVWKKVKEISKVAGLAAVMAMLGTENASGGIVVRPKENSKLQIDKLKSDITKKEKEIKKIVKQEEIDEMKPVFEKFRLEIAQKEKEVEKIVSEKGISSHGVEGMETKEFKSHAGDTVTVGHYPDGKVWISVQTVNKMAQNANQITFLDKNNNGSLDVAVVNHEGGGNDLMEKNQAAENLIEAFSEDIGSLANAQLKPANKKIMEFLENNGELSVKILNMKTGEKDILEGMDAYYLKDTFENNYLDTLKSFEEKKDKK